MRTMLAAAAAVATAAVMLAGCGDEDPSEAIGDEPAGVSLADLDGRTFASVRVDGHRLVGDTRVRLMFDSDTVRAHAGCNHLSGTVALDGATLVADHLGGTEMGCPDGLGEQDEWLAELLGAGPEVALDGDRLTLTGDGVVLELAELPEEDAPASDGDQPTSDDGAVVGSG
jgi:heat shock protein HslJ